MGRTCEDGSKDDDVEVLITYSINGDLAKMRQLLGKGVDVNAKGRSCRNSSDVCLPPGHLEMTEMLLNNGAYVDARNDFGWTALMEATLWGRIFFAKLHVKQEAEQTSMQRTSGTRLL